MTRLASILTPILAVAALSGCVERRIWIDTEPAGALVWVNDAQVGRSPVDIAFTHEGTYDLRIEKEGYEPLVTPATTNGPVWDVAPLDLICEILPINATNESRWTFTLTRRDDSEEALVSRATEMRGRLGGTAASGAGTAPAAAEAPATAPAPTETPRR